MDTLNGHVIYDSLTDELFYLRRTFEYSSFTALPVYRAEDGEVSKQINLLTEPFIKINIKNGRIIDLGLLEEEQ